MASIVKRPKGERWIQFSFQGKRPTIRLGICDKDQAIQFKAGLERLISEHRMGHSPGQQTVAWLDSLSTEMRDRLAVLKLIKESPNHSLSEFMDIVFRRLDIKDSTRRGYSRVKTNLLEYFGADRNIGSITPGDAEDFRAWLGKQNAYRKDGKLAATTVSKRCQRAREFFDVAIKKRWLSENPFSVLRGWVDSNPSRMEFVDRDKIAKVMKNCDAEWQLILGLCRFGGLRCPSEVNALCWHHVDWDENVFHVQSPKTERYAGKASRVVPIFAELRPYLEEAWDRAGDGAVHVIRRRCSGQALTNQLERILKRANVPQWEKLFQNLRSTRETELMERFPTHVVCAWIGNSPRIARRHYLQITKDHITQAVSGDANREAKRNAKQTNAANS